MWSSMSSRSLLPIPSPFASLETTRNSMSPSHLSNLETTLDTVRSISPFLSAALGSLECDSQRNLSAAMSSCILGSNPLNSWGANPAEQKAMPDTLPSSNATSENVDAEIRPARESM